MAHQSTLDIRTITQAYILLNLSYRRSKDTKANRKPRVHTYISQHMLYKECLASSGLFLSLLGNNIKNTPSSVK